LAKIEKLVYGGDGLARVDGKVTFIPFSIPGEEWVDGQLATAASERIAARCPVFTKCGGCHYQHLPYAEQLTWKGTILRETLARLGGVEAPPVSVIEGDPWGYRNRVQVHFDGRRMGFHGPRSNAVVAVDECAVASPAIQHAMTVLRDAAPPFLKSVELFSNEESTLVSVVDSGKPLRKGFFDDLAKRIPGAGASHLEYPVGPDRFRVSYRAFFQVNRFLIEELVRLAVGVESGATAWDLYAGVGLMSIPLARQVDRVTAVEVVSSASHDLEMNAQRHGSRLNAVRGSTEDFLAAQTEAPELVLADPPRAGLGKRVTDHLLRLRPERITLVSCDPSTLARDLRELTRAYAIESVAMIDLFPQTFHIESVTRLIRA
jgi:23S rRNA (uracil1939-C5)-methyltransferase